MKRFLKLLPVILLGLMVLGCDGQKSETSSQKEVIGERSVLSEISPDVDQQTQMNVDSEIEPQQQSNVQFASVKSDFDDTEEKPTTSEDKTVYITKTGSKYHSSGCRHLSKSKIPINRNDAISRGYSACKVCGG